MKGLYFYLFIVLTTLSWSCEQKKQKGQGHSDNVAADSTSNEQLFSKEFSQYSEKLQRVVSSDSLMFRNLEFGMTSAEVRWAEKEAKHLETGEDYIAYTLDFGLDESVDLEYYFDSTDHLREVVVTDYFFTRGSRDSSFQEYVEYYDSKLGSHNSIANWNAEWKSGDGYRVRLQKQGVGNNLDLRLRFWRLDIP